MKITIQSTENDRIIESQIIEIKEGSNLIINFPNHYSVSERQFIMKEFKLMLSGVKNLIAKPNDVTYEILSIE